MKTFIVIWLGQALSMMGSNVTAFGISIWVYQETGSVTLFALNSFLNFLPRTLLSPLAGLIADQYKRRYIMIASDSGAAISTVFLAALFFSGQLAVWHVYLVTLANALFNTFQAPAYTAAVSAMTPSEQHARASAMLQLSNQLSMLVAPMIAGFVLLFFGLVGILMLDFITFFIAIGILVLHHFPEPQFQQKTAVKNRSWPDMFKGWRFISSQPALRGLFYLSGLNMFFIAVNATLSIPILLTLTTIEVVGLLAMLFGLGGILGSVLVIAWRRVKQHIWIVFGAHLFIGIGLIVFGLRPNLLLLIIAGFGLAVAIPIRDSITDTIWRTTIASDLQGRVFALLQLANSTAFGLAYIVVGPLADHIFEPWMLRGGLLADSVGQIVGVGSGRGLAFGVILAGIFTLSSTIITMLNRPVRQLTVKLPEKSPVLDV